MERRFFLRLHMFLILAATFLAGVAASRLLMPVVGERALRYPLAVVAAYLVFLALIRLWLAYVQGDGFDLDAAGDAAGASLEIGGDSFPDSISDVPLDFDELSGLLFLVVVAVVGATGIYFIYTAPFVFAEIAFEALVAGILTKRARTLERRGWAVATWRATMWPFLLSLVAAAVVGAYL